MVYLEYIFFFFFKQKTAYEMRISDWSSDVCSSDLFGGARIAEHALEQPRPAVAGDDADLDEAARELRALGGDADITGAGEFAAEADCMAVDRGDHRDLAVHQRADHRLNAAAIVGAGRIGLVEHADALAIQHRFQIAAGAERLAAAGQDDSADPAILAERSEEHTSELQSLMRISYAVFCLK